MLKTSITYPRTDRSSKRSCLRIFKSCGEFLIKKEEDCEAQVTCSIFGVLVFLLLHSLTHLGERKTVRHTALLVVRHLPPVPITPATPRWPQTQTMGTPQLRCAIREIPPTEPGRILGPCSKFLPRDQILCPKQICNSYCDFLPLTFSSQFRPDYKTIGSKTGNWEN